MRYISCFTISCLLFGVAVAAQSASPQTKWPLRSIAIEGNQNYTDQQLIAATGLKLGEPVNKEILTAAQRRLLDTGILETVAFHFGPASTGDGYAVSYEVTEIQQVYPIQFVNMEVPDEELFAWLKQIDPLFAPRMPATEQLIERYAKALEKFLEGKGITEEIRGELAADQPDQFYIMFHPKGAMPIIAEVDFVGNKTVTTERLQEAIQGVAIGSRYTEGRIRTLLASSIVPVYGTRGRVDVKFPKIETERAGGDVNGIRVIVTVDEGDSYSFGRVEIAGSMSYQHELYLAADLKPGDIANTAEVLSAIERIKDTMHSNGYMAASAQADQTINRTKKTVDVLITVDPGPRYTFGQLFLEGLDLNGEYAIKKVWGMKPGDTFDPSYPDFFLQRVKEEALFDNLRKTLSKFHVNDDTLTVDVTLVFNPEERKMRFGSEEPEESPRRGRRRP